MTDQSQLSVELTASFARRTAEGVRIVLTLAEPLPFSDSEELHLQLRSGKRVVRIPATQGESPHELGGITLTTTAPRDQVRRGLWRLALISGTGAPVPVQARLLNNVRQPVALLPGPVPTTRMEHPTRREQPPAPAPKFYKAAARVARKGLEVLPEQQAKRLRPWLRKAAKKLPK